MSKKKILIPLASISIVASVAVPLVTISLTKKNKNKIEEKVQYKLNQDEVFPTIDKNEFYNYIRYEQNRAIFDKSIVNAIFNYVLANMQTNVDKLDFDYNFINESQLNIKFIAYNANNIFTKSYTLNATINSKGL
ncbi:hypothetical protein EG856_02935 [Mycoplasmopsis phocirhinis]|uniref:Uncharacterized protein n=1 Tax=Mycoplasmopsis phocirhinis TaxID=142650 RepID=A0A4V0ZAI8_9BACT|nr:hypothetical protein [Mycoplasmopsis phocirhinis]QBF34852.1 hypothetical protein EG856_02935 [Mycoplasmopsis phocirhinis]